VPPKSKALSLKAGSLNLDAKNARIPPERRSDDQRALLHALLEFEDVKALAASISKLGLFPNERLIVIADGRRFTVLEGNRRLAAIKLLLNPQLAPTPQLVTYFRRLASKINLTDFGKLDAVVMPSRIAAAPVIAALHTRRPKKRWMTIQQARFYRELLAEGQSPEEIAEDLGITVGQVQSYLRSETLYRLALQQQYPPEIRAKIENPNYPISTLERFADSKTGRAFLGIELDEKHGFVGKVHPDRFKAVLAYVAAEIATRPGMTRTVNNEEDFKKYVAAAEPKIPKTNLRGAFTPAEIDTDAGPSAAKETPKPSRPKRPPRPSPSIIPRGFQCAAKNARVCGIFDELKKIDAAAQRNTTGVMLRVLIDVALWSFLKDTGHADAATDHFDSDKRKRGKNPDWTPALRDLLSYAVDKRLFPGMAADGYKATRTLVSKDAQYFVTIEGFNAFTHNPFVVPTEGDLRALWTRAEPMLQIILN
jgi:hypothetical protein